ncbi:4Fe-4S dicluster containing protein [Pseudomonas linyingensis]|uniref:4Fe-4S dicluster containing protein n=1 Tax=Pseudomonas linyingensis TaxID=915471 RepID=A0A1H6Z2L0_9PSED|nr:4Fe-4S dicluster domain-containing protein [Pseudomonas linyingensis]SEJ47803.1 4Fe-4S dicluster containing protein [Pseudomonas linyingensis]
MVPSESRHFDLTCCELDSVERLRAHLAGGRTLYEVREDGQGGRHWQALTADDPTPFVAQTEPPPFAAKAFFFAEREAVFRFDGERFVAIEPTAPAQVLFGLHACDLAAVAYQDQFFAADAHYQARRAAALLVGLDCRHSCSQGFCTLVDSGPEVRAGTADLILLPTEAGWLLLIASVAGAAAVADLALPAASRDWPAQRVAHRQQVASEQGDGQWLQDGIAAINAAKVSAATWESLGLRCLVCSGCTTVCPTCSCFAPLERKLPDGSIEQERVWDSCLYEGFQKEASGHNPSALAGQRVQRFWQHKFGEGFRQTFGRYGCVGCGRCDHVCPGGIGVHAVMRKVGKPCSN